MTSESRMEDDILNGHMAVVVDGKVLVVVVDQQGRPKD